MTTINVNLTGQQVIDIANTLADVAGRLEASAAAYPDVHVAHAAEATKLRGYGRQLIRALARADTHNQNVPVVIEDNWKPEDY